METNRFEIPPSARLVHAAGRVAAVSLADEYDPSPESGRRREFLNELDQLAQAERDEFTRSANIIL